MPGHCPRIGGALHVILPAQRVEPGSGPADIAGEQGQVDQGQGILGAVRMFGDA